MCTNTKKVDNHWAMAERKAKLNNIQSRK